MTKIGIDCEILCWAQLRYYILTLSRLGSKLSQPQLHPWDMWKVRPLESVLSGNFSKFLKCCERLSHLHFVELIQSNGLVNLTHLVQCTITKSSSHGKHRKNCEWCPRHSLFKGYNVNVNIVVLNCQKCNQCLKCQVSGHKSLGLLFEVVLEMSW